MYLKKLLLASAIATVSSASFAMQSMDDEALAQTTGQDGLTIGITTAALTADIVIHDGEGYGGVAPTNDSGALVIDGFGLNTGGNAITAVIDTTGNAGSPVLNVAVTIPTGTIINTGAIQVADSNGVGVAVDDVSANILENMTITLGATTANIQLGNEIQGSMIALNTTMTNGLSIANFALNDANSGGSFNADSISISDAGASADLTVDADVDFTGTGMSIVLNTLGTGGMDISMTNVGLGANATAGVGVGDIDVLGLNLTGTTITIAGH